MPNHTIKIEDFKDFTTDVTLASSSSPRKRLIYRVNVINSGAIMHRSINLKGGFVILNHLNQIVAVSDHLKLAIQAYNKVRK
jgi:hypothetical protein